MEAGTSFPILTARDLERLESFHVAAFGAERTYAFPSEGRDIFVVLSRGDPQRSSSTVVGAATASRRSKLTSFALRVSASATR